MNPKIIMNVHTVRSIIFWFFLTGIVRSPSFPSPGATPSSNLTPFLTGEVGAPVGVPGPEGVKSWGALRLRFEGRSFAAGAGRDDGKDGENELEDGGDWERVSLDFFEFEEREDLISTGSVLVLDLGAEGAGVGDSGSGVAFLLAEGMLAWAFSRPSCTTSLALEAVSSTLVFTAETFLLTTSLISSVDGDGLLSLSLSTLLMDAAPLSLSFRLDFLLSPFCLFFAETACMASSLNPGERTGGAAAALAV